MPFMALLSSFKVVTLFIKQNLDQARKPYNELKNVRYFKFGMFSTHEVSVQVSFMIIVVESGNHS